jgi:hypothetical protein
LNVDDLLKRIKIGQAEEPTIVAFDAEQIIADPMANNELHPQLDYFDVTVNELFLSYKRKWFKTYDPLVYTVVEFQYGTERRYVPFVIGPQLVRGAGTGNVPEAQGVVLTDTRVAGLYPAKGETLAITAMLCRVEQKDYLRGALQMIEKVSAAIDIGSVLVPYLRIADVVTGALNQLLDSDGTQSLAGFRRELRLAKAVRSPSYFALIAKQDADTSGLWVRGGRLVRGDSADRAVPYRDEDFVLVSLCASDSRLDVETLPFYPLWQQVSREAQRAVNDELWQQRAKGALYTLSEAIYDSPDLTEGQRDALIDEYEQRAVMLRDRARRRATLGPEDKIFIEDRPRSTRILEL